MPKRYGRSYGGRLRRGKRRSKRFKNSIKRSLIPVHTYKGKYETKIESGDTQYTWWCSPLGTVGEHYDLLKKSQQSSVHNYGVPDDQSAADGGVSWISNLANNAGVVNSFEYITWRKHFRFRNAGAATVNMVIYEIRLKRDFWMVFSSLYNLYTTTQETTAPFKNQLGPCDMLLAAMVYGQADIANDAGTDAWSVAGGPLSATVFDDFTQPITNSTSDTQVDMTVAINPFKSRMFSTQFKCIKKSKVVLMPGQMARYSIKTKFKFNEFHDYQPIYMTCSGTRNTFTYPMLGLVCDRKGWKCMLINQFGADGYASAGPNYGPQATTVTVSCDESIGFQRNQIPGLYNQVIYANPLNQATSADRPDLTTYTGGSTVTYQYTNAGGANALTNEVVPARQVNAH